MSDVILGKAKKSGGFGNRASEEGPLLVGVGRILRSGGVKRYGDPGTQSNIPKITDRILGKDGT